MRPMFHRHFRFLSHQVMSFISDELAKALKSAYRMEENEREETRPSSKTGKKNDEDSSKEKRSRKHKHKKHSKSKSKDKKKHKKRKHKSRSRSQSRSESRSRSRSRSGEREVIKSKGKSRTSSSRSNSSEETETNYCDSKGNGFEREKDSPLRIVKNATEDDEKQSENLCAQGLEESNTLEFTKEAQETLVDKSSISKFGSKSPEASTPRVKSATSDVRLKVSSCENDASISENQSEEHSNLNKDLCSDTNVFDAAGLKDSKEENHSSSVTQSKDEPKSRSRSRSTTKERSVESKISRSRSRSNHKTSRSRSRSYSRNSKSSKKSTSQSRSRNKRSRSRSRNPSRRKKSRSRSHSRQSKSKSRSRSHSRHKKSKSRSRSHSSCKKSKSRSLSKSRHKKWKSRSRSHSRRKKSKSRSLSKSRSRSHSRRNRSPSRTRSRSYSRHSRSRSRTRRKSPISRHYQKYSPPRWRRNIDSYRRRRSRSVSRSSSRGRTRAKQRSRSRSRSWSRRRRSPSYSRRRRSRSHSPSRSRSSSRNGKNNRRNKSKSRSKSKEKTQFESVSSAAAPANMPTKVSSVIDKPVATEMTSQQSRVAARSGGKTIAELTAFCKQLIDKKENDNSNNLAALGTTEDDAPVLAHHPFLLKEKPDVVIPPVIFPVKHPLALSASSNKPLQEQFPVSSGTKHREKEVVTDGESIVTNVDGFAALTTEPQSTVFEPPPTEKLDISALVAKRMEAQRRLQTDPNDIEAMLALQEIQMKMQNWCQSNVKPGQFTGELVKSLLPKEDLNGGYQAWAKKDMFQNLSPVSGGIGMKLLQKMGWKPGQVIGKRGEGFAEPIALTVKVDRKGLSTVKEKPTKNSRSMSTVDLQGKHPVSALAEFCSKRKWQLPDYSLVFDHGPAHSKQFLFKVLVNGTEYQPAVVCSNKKQAKAQAAIFALKGLGIIPENAEISAV